MYDVRERKAEKGGSLELGGLGWVINEYEKSLLAIVKS